MSREMLKARDKVIVKNTRDGLVEHNAETGEDVRVSKREADFELKRKTPEQESGVRRQREHKPHNHRPAPRSDVQSPEGMATEHTVYSQSAGILEKFEPKHSEPLPDAPKANNSRAYRRVYEQAENAKPVFQESAVYVQGDDRPGMLQFRQDEPAPDAAPDSNIKLKHKKAQVQAEHANQEKILETAETPETAELEPAMNGQSFDMPEKLQFKHDAAAVDATNVSHARIKSKMRQKAGGGKGKAQKSKKLRQKSAASEKRASTKQSLKFEDTAPVPKGKKGKQVNAKRPMPVNPAKTAANAFILNAHRKIYETENENVGTKAAHRAEMTGEVGVRSALRHHRNKAQQNTVKPEAAAHNKAVKAENAPRKKSSKLSHGKAASQDPKKKANKLSKALQKQKTKRKYAKAASDAKNKAEKVKKAGEATAKAAKAVTGFIKRHPVVSITLLVVGLLAVMLMSVFSSAGNLGSTSVSAIVLTTYLADDADMYAAEAAYAAMEEELQYYLDNYETLNPDYDEYIYDLDEIWHDPYVLMSILSAFHEGEWTIGEVQDTLSMLFDKQYILTETVVKEVRYRTETRTYTDPYTGEEHEYEVDVPYDYYIVTVELENFNLSHLPVYMMSEERLSRYATLMWTLGNRPDLFNSSQFPHASSYKDYEKYDIPPEHLSDEKFAAMMEEATKYLGMPYVWGGSNPNTSFDCSGFVSWVLNNSGWNVGRLGATALYGVCTPVSPSNAKPGDLVFFHSTYETSAPITHVGIYVGNGMMIHAGNPISYASINTTYYQNHFYGFGRP